MIENFSPLSRRIVAVGLLILLVLLSINLVIVPVVGRLFDTLDELENSRMALARLQAIRQRPIPPKGKAVPSELYLIAGDHQAAGDLLAARLATVADQQAVEISGLSLMGPMGAEDRAIRLSASVTGDQEKLLAFINAIEQGPPAVRFENWSLKSGGEVPAVAAAPVKLEFRGVAAVAWRPS